MSKNRIYVKRGGKDLETHPLHNANWSGSGPWIGFVDGYPVRDRVTTIDWSKKTNIFEYYNAADVQDAPVMMKVWYGPDGGEADFFVFATHEQIVRAGKEMREAVWNDKKQTLVPGRVIPAGSLAS